MSDSQGAAEASSSKKSCAFSGLCFWRKNKQLDGAEKPFGLGLLILLLCIITIALIGYFTSKAALSVQMVESRLSEWSEIVKESAARKGYDASFSYGAISIEGGLFSKRAVIATPKLELSSHGKILESFGTAKVELMPENSAMAKMRVVLPAPVKVMQNAKTRRYESPVPLEMNVSVVGDGQGYDADFPMKLNVYEEGEAVGAEIPYATLETAAGGKISGYIGAGAEEYSQRITLRKTSYKTADRTLRVENVDVQAEAAKEDAARLTHYDIKLGKLYTSGMFSMLSPMDVALDVDRETPSTLVAQSAGTHKEVSYFVNSLSITSGSTVLNLTGKFDVMPEEILPLGSAEINVTSVGALLERMRAAGVLDARSLQITRDLLKKVATEWSHKDKDVLKLIVEREYGGGFFIGDTTFEELLALALKAYLLDSRSGIGEAHDADALDTDILSNGGLNVDAPAASGGEKPVNASPVIDAAPKQVDPAEEKGSSADTPAPVTPDATAEEQGGVHVPDDAAKGDDEHSDPVQGESPAAMESLEEGAASDVPAATTDSPADKKEAVAPEKESVSDSIKSMIKSVTGK
jgi:hypothetical protein